MATIHTFTGNEVIATEVPKYLNDNFSALNNGVTNLERTVVKTVNGEKPVNNNVNIIGFDSYWGANEPVQIGDVRFPKGRENSGYIFECISAGTTGSTQPEFLENGSIELANFADLGKIGSVRVIFNMAEKEVDEVLALGVLYSRSTYPELWEWAGKRAGLIISEVEWQQKYTESNGKFVPYYSLGDGSTTFRTPLLGAYLKGAEASADVGKYVEAGLPYHSHKIYAYTEGGNGEDGLGNFITSNSSSGKGYMNQKNYAGEILQGSDIYGNSDTVTPETMTGVWVIKAIGIVVDSGETDLANVLHAVEQVQSQIQDTINDVEVKISNINTHTVPDYSSQVKLKYNTNNTMSNDGFIRFWLHWPSDYGHDMTIVINGSKLPIQTNDNHGHDTILYPVKKGDVVKYSSSRGSEFCSAIFFKVR